MSRRSLAGVLGALVVCLSPAIQAQGPDAEPTLDMAWVTDQTWGLGGPVEYTLRLSALELDLAGELWVQEELAVSPGYETDFPDILPGDLEGLGLARIVDLDPQTRDGMTVRRRRLLLEPERVGEAALAERWVFFEQPGQLVEPEGTLRTNRLALEVHPLPADLDLTLPPAAGIFTADPAPDAPPRWPWLAALVAPFAAVIWWWRRRPERPAPPPRPAHELALASLARLDALELVARGDLEGQFVYLAAILRDYVEARFGLRAPERTTQEFLREAERASELTAHRDLLRSFLRQADAIKFAQEAPQADEAQAARATVEQFVRATRSEAPALAALQVGGPALQGAGA